MAVLIMPAAGSGTRFGAATPKQVLPLAGIPVLRRSLDAFVGLVDMAIIATAAACRDQITAICAGSPIPVRIVEGGATRQASVYAALRAVPAGETVALVHDAVRPFVPRTCIVACLHALTRHAAALVALPVSDTVKRGEVDTALVAATVARDHLYLAQTPQGLRVAEAQAAFARAQAEGWQASDDAQIMERAGHTVALVAGDRRNLKITTPEDWALAEALVALAGG